MTAQPTAGRPRDPQKDIDVLNATRELLVTEGFQATTIVAIARRAGVGAPTIYRRWPRREALIEDAAFSEVEPTEMPRASGDLWTDVRLWTARFLHRFADPVTRAAIPGLLTAYQHDAALFARLVERSENDARALLTELLSGYLTGLAPEALVARANAVFDFLLASTAIRALTIGLVDEQSYCDHTADALTALALSTWTPAN